MVHNNESSKFYLISNASNKYILIYEENKTFHKFQLKISIYLWNPWRNKNNVRIGALDVDCDGHWWWKAGPIPHKQRERGAGGTHVLDCEWTTPPPHQSGPGCHVSLFHVLLSCHAVLGGRCWGANQLHQLASPYGGGIIWMLWGVGIQFLSTHCLVVLLHFSKPHQTSKR